MSPQEVHDVLVHIRGDHLEGDALVLEHRGRHDGMMLCWSHCDLFTSSPVTTVFTGVRQYRAYNTVIKRGGERQVTVTDIK